MFNISNVVFVIDRQESMNRVLHNLNTKDYVWVMTYWKSIQILDCTNLLFINQENLFYHLGANPFLSLTLLIDVQPMKIFSKNKLTKTVKLSRLCILQKDMKIPQNTAVTVTESLLWRSISFLCVLHTLFTSIVNIETIRVCR